MLHTPILFYGDRRLSVLKEGIMGIRKPDLEAERDELEARLKSLVPLDLQANIQAAVNNMPQPTPFTVRISHLGAFDADTE